MYGLDKQHIVLFGYSGHAYVVADIAQLCSYYPIAYFDRNENVHNPYRLSYLGNEEKADWNLFRSCFVFPAVGSNAVRKKMLLLFEKQQLNQLILIHPQAIVATNSSVGNSTMLAAGAVINPLAKIGQGCIINTGAIVEHECVIGNFCHIASGAVLAGDVQLGEGCFIGANAVVKQGVRIGSAVTVGAGSVVVKDIPDGELWLGNPARKRN